MPFSRQANPIWIFRDLDGNPLSDAYYCHFKSNVFPYVGQAVYQDSAGSVPYSNPLELEANGSLPPNVYWDESKTYRLEVRQGPLDSDPLVALVEDYVPMENGSSPVNTADVSGENMLTNPQFTRLYFTDTLTISNTGTTNYSIAPGWTLELVGTGTAVVSRIAIPGSPAANPIPGNPPYVLSIVTSGLTTCYLRQRFMGNPAIWANDGVSASIVAKSEDGISRQVQILYRPSTGTTEIIAQGSLNTSVYTQIGNGIVLDASTNTESAPDAYTDILFQLPATGSVRLSNFQILGEYLDSPVMLPFDQSTRERQLDQMFNIYADELLYKQRQNLLVGWNFPVNPYQFRSQTSAAVTSQCQYVADQTIIYQLAANTVTAGQAALADGKGFEVKAINGTTNNRFALISYIHPESLRDAWENIVSMMVKAKFKSQHSTTMRLKFRLIYRSSVPPQLSGTEPIASWTGDDPVFQTGWTEIEPLNDPEHTMEINPTISDGLPRYPFERMSLPAADNADMTLGVVVYTLDNMDDSAGTEDSIVFESGSLIKSVFAADAAYESKGETLRRCEYYYEKSYELDDLPGDSPVQRAAVLKAANINPTDGSGAITAHSKSFEIPYKTIKGDLTPDVVLYNPTTGSSTTVRVFIQRTGGSLNDGDATKASFWTETVACSRKVDFIAVNLNNTLLAGASAAPGSYPEAYIKFHYTIDGRLGR